MLCLVSTGFLRLARLRLYSRPFLASLSADWATASALLSSLVKRKGTLGSLVRSLYGILSYTIRLYRDIKPQIPYKALKHFDWYISIIRACPNLDEMEVAADTEEELEQILQAIRSTKLVSVNFGRFGGLSGPLSTNDHLARKALQHPAFRNVEKISLHRLLVDLEDSTSIIPQAIKSVNLDDNYREHARAQQLMPVDCSDLVQFRLTTWVRYEHIVTYLTSLPSTIRNISLNIKDDREIKRFFDYTTDPRTTPEFSATPFFPFPFLNSVHSQFSSSPLFHLVYSVPSFVIVLTLPTSTSSDPFGFSTFLTTIELPGSNTAKPSFHSRRSSQSLRSSNTFDESTSDMFQPRRRLWKGWKRQRRRLDSNLNGISNRCHSDNG